MNFSQNGFLVYLVDDRLCGAVLADMSLDRSLFPATAAFQPYRIQGDCALPLFGEAGIEHQSFVVCSYRIYFDGNVLDHTLTMEYPFRPRRQH